MKHRTADIPGLRQPTQQEIAWIAQMWGPAVPGVRKRGAGKFLRYAGIFLICVGAAGFAQRGEGLAGTILLLILGATSLASAKFVKYAAKEANQRQEALCRGEYMVAKAESVEIRTGNYHGAESARVDVILPNGEKLSPEIPFACAQSLLKKGMQQVPVLLIQIPGDPDLLAIPCESE
ncbi:MAG: hypothetical protein IJO45_03215 [Oscillospiraceae bacterium]|nr:hypothetical protein [Oscillospiraceae bacterium]